MEAVEFDWFVGIDWASVIHDVQLLDGTGALVAHRRVAHSGSALAELAEWLTARSGGRPERVAVGIELTRGALVEGLLAHGFAVFGINPKQLDRFRDRYTVAGAKDDRRDAFVLADTLRTDRDRYRRLAVSRPRLIALRALVETQEELADDERRLANRLRAVLERYYPQVLTLAPAADEPWVWTLLELVPTPARAAGVTAARVRRVLHRHRIRRVDGPTVLATLQQRALPVAPGTAEAAAGQALLLVARLRLAHTQRAQCDKQLAAALDDLAGDEPESDVALLRSLPGVGCAVAAALLVDASELLAARDHERLRCQTGIAPVTRRSGKRRTVLMRYACSARLRRAMYHWALGSMQRTSASRAIYAAARARGHSHGRALRGLADRLLRVLIAMLRTRTPYDPQRLEPAT
jgi:transposase